MACSMLSNSLVCSGRSAAQQLGHPADLAVFVTTSETAQSQAARTRRRRMQLAPGSVTLFAVVMLTVARDDDQRA